MCWVHKECALGQKNKLCRILVSAASFLLQLVGSSVLCTEGMHSWRETLCIYLGERSLLGKHLPAYKPFSIDRFICKCMMCANEPVTHFPIYRDVVFALPSPQLRIEASFKASVSEESKRKMWHLLVTGSTWWGRLPSSNVQCQEPRWAFKWIWVCLQRDLHLSLRNK